MAPPMRDGWQRGAWHVRQGGASAPAGGWDGQGREAEVTQRDAGIAENWVPLLLVERNLTLAP